MDMMTVLYSGGPWNLFLCISCKILSKLAQRMRKIDAQNFTRRIKVITIDKKKKNKLNNKNNDKFLYFFYIILHKR